MPRALLSVSDKTGLADFARELVALGWTLVASGGSARALRAAGLPATDVAEVTGAPEMLGGRVKTLHPAIHGGILARNTAADLAELAQHDVQPIDLVVCNLYPFRETAARAGVSLADAVEHIDIGGVALLRAAAKNFERVAVICDPADYVPVLAELRSAGKVPCSSGTAVPAACDTQERLLSQGRGSGRKEAVSEVTRRRLAAKAFAHTRDYDTAIAAYLSVGAPAAVVPYDSPLLSQGGLRKGDVSQAPLALRYGVSLRLMQTMRYGENPHQSAGLYAHAQADAYAGPLGGRVLHGKQLSYNNLLDLDAAWRAAASFDAPTIVIVKHLSPCGIASAHDLPDAFRAALASDPVSAFGGVIAANREFDSATADALQDLFVEAIAAPSFGQAALDHLVGDRPGCRLVEIRHLVQEIWEMRSVAGGVLVQSVDRGDPPGALWRVVTKRQPTDDEMAGLRMAWNACQHVKSNAIVLVRDSATVGIGGGLPSRVDAVRLAVVKAGERARGAVMASDAFFPFADGVEVAAQAGVRAIVQPGGSVRDEDVIATADRLELAMVFTGVRHFRH